MEAKNEKELFEIEGYPMNNSRSSKYQTKRVILSFCLAWSLALGLVSPVISATNPSEALSDGPNYSIYLPLVINRYPAGEREVCQGSNGTVVIIVEPELLQGIQTGLSQLEQDICDSGLGVIEDSEDYASPPLLRSYLVDLYSRTGQTLKGAILVGNFPHIYQFFVWPSNPPLNIEAPSYEYYSDLDGTFSTTPDYVSMGDHAYSFNQHLGDTGWEIWVGLLPRDTDTQTTIEGINRYLAKNHAYRIGQLQLPASYMLIDHEQVAQTVSEYNSYMEINRTGWNSWMPFSNAANAHIYFESSDPPLSLAQAYAELSAGLVDVVVQYGHGNSAQTGSITFDWLNQNPLKVAFLASGNCSTASPDAGTNILTRILYHPNSTVVVAQGATGLPGGRGSQTADGQYGDNIAAVLSAQGRFGEAYFDYINKPTVNAAPDNELGNVLHFVLALMGDPTLRLYR